MLRLGLALAARVLGEPLPAAARAPVLVDATALALAAQVEARLFDPGYEPPSVFRLSRFRLRMRERASDRVACLARTLVTPQIAHLRLLRLPRALRPLYGVVTPAIDYLALPLRRRLGPKLLRGARGAARTLALRALSPVETPLVRGLDALAAELAFDHEARLLDALGPGARVLALGEEAAPLASAFLAGAGAAENGAGSRRAVRCAPGPPLPFAAACFDAVVCRTAWIFWEDSAAGLSEVRRVLDRGGRVALAAFGPRSANPLLAAVDRVVCELLGERGASLGAALAPFAARGALSRLLRRAGFERVEERTLLGALEPPAAREAARSLALLCAGLEREHLPSAARAAFEASLSEALPAGVVRAGLRVAVGVLGPE
jgi:SAM-dependent methyltransferase